MESPDIDNKEISSLIPHPRYVSEQPIDRHLIEITDENKSVFINAGIDSTCGKKRASIIHGFTNGTITSRNSMSLVNKLDLLTLTNHHSSNELKSNEHFSISICQSNNHISECCSQCGK